MARPALGLYFAFGTAPWTLPGIAYDQSVYMRSASCHRGRQHELQTFDAGSSTVVLNNYDRRFDPRNSAGPWAGQIKTGVRFALNAYIGGTEYPICQHWVAKWKPERPNVMAGRMAVTGAGAFGKLRKTSLLSSDYPTILSAAHTPTAYYRLSDTDGNVRDSGPNALHGSIVPGAQPELSPVTGSLGGVITDVDGGALFPAGANNTPSGSFLGGAGYISLPSSAGQLGAGALTVGLLFRQAGLGSPRIDWRHASGSQFIIAPLQEGVYYAAPGPVGWGSLGLGNDLADDRWHLLVWTRDADTVTNRVYVDGQIVVVGTASGAVDFDAGADTLKLTPAYDDPTTDARIDEFFTIAGYRMPDAAVAALWEEAQGKWASQSPKDRLDAVLDSRGWPASARVFSAGSAVLGPVTESLALTPMLDHMQAVERSEAGLLFERADGKIELIGRHDLLGPPYTTSVFTFGDGPGEIPYEPAPESWLDETDVYPEAISTRVGGQPQRAINQAAEDEFGPATLTRDGLLYADDNQSRDLSNWNVAHYSLQQTRLGVLRIHAGVLNPAWWPLLLSLDIGDRVTVNERPTPKTTPMATYVGMIEGIDHDFPEDTDDWWITFALGPVDPYTYWVLGTSALGINTRLAM